MSLKSSKMFTYAIIWKSSMNNFQFPPFVIIGHVDRHFGFGHRPAATPQPLGGSSIPLSCTKTGRGGMSWLVHPRVNILCALLSQFRWS